MKKYVLTLLGMLLASDALAHGMSVSDQERIANAGFMEYIDLGAWHMLTGYDHLLFLFGVVFFLTRFTDIIKFVTAFTLGHSVTLIFATLYGIQANYYLVDAVIALTVCYKAFENLDGFKRYLNSRSPNLTWMVFGFGLIHGFGLSTRLQQLPLGDDGIVLKIIAFNIGVEVGQVIALTVLLFLLSRWRRTESFSRFSLASNVGLMAAGSLLLLMQLHGYQHSTFSEEFPLNRDAHLHVHEDMQATRAPAALEGYSKPLIPSAKPDAEPEPVTANQPSPAAVHSHGGTDFHSH